MCNTLRWATYWGGDNLSGVQHTAESRALILEKKLGGVQHTVEIISAVSAVCSIPRRWSPRCATHRKDDFLSVQPTAEMISSVCNPPQRWFPRCATHRRDDIRGVQLRVHTAEINCTPRNQNRNLHLSVVAFKETIRRNPFRGEPGLEICSSVFQAICSFLWAKEWFTHEKEWIPPIALL